MKKLLLASAVALFALPALAADLPVYSKAPAYVATPCVAGSCSGWYADFGIMGDGSNADIIGGGLNNSIFQSGGALMVGGGYQLWQGPVLAGIQGNIGYEFTGQGVSVPGSKALGTVLVQLGYNFFNTSTPAATSATTTPGQSPWTNIVPANLLAASTP